MTMDQTGVVVSAGSGHSGDGGEHRSCEMAELRFQEEIQSLMRQNLLGDDNSNNSSFTALLGLAPNQAMELLHNPHHEIPAPVAVQIPLVDAYGCVVAEEQNHGPVTPKFVDFPQFRCSPTFPSNAALVERAARYSVFASEGSSPETSVVPSNSGNNSSLIVKSEPAGSDSDPPAPKSHPKRTSGKRKEPEKNKAKGSGKKSKTVDGGGEEYKNGGFIGGGDKLPYVHVRARRGQATDSHSLAERARREKINARMKLLQELVPGCSKISGTALVLDEIINHVQSLQRQVEFLSMKLSAVNPRIDFGGLDTFLAPENARVTGCNGGNVGLGASMWPEINHDGVRRQQQIWQVDLLSSSQHQPSSSMWDRDDDHNQHHGFISSGPLLFGLDSTNPGCLGTMQKTLVNFLHRLLCCCLFLCIH